MDDDSQLEVEKFAKCLGTARVQLQWLFFQNREISAKHVQTLRTSFQNDCRRLDVRNRIPAIIDQQDFESALRLSGISQEQLVQSPPNQIPELGFWGGYRLECLHGRHRVEAAKLALAPWDKWWAVDLYLAEMSNDLRVALTEEYANEERPSDGEIYQKIRKYRREKQAGLEERWWARMSPHKASNLRQLFQHNDYTVAFDSFLELPALLTGLRISTLHKMFAIRCDEEILRYLRYIKNFWFELLQQDKAAMAKVDQVTVEELQVKAPWASTIDAQVLRGKVLGGEVFRSFSQEERGEVWTRLQSYKGMIPSLSEFFENLKCLEAWTNCLKWLLRLNPRQTLYMAMENMYSDEDQSIDSALVQESETVFRTVPASPQHRLDLGYRQLFSFAMRYYREIPKKPTGKDLLARPTPAVDTARLRDMADLASQLGFESSEIRTLREYSKSEDCAVAIVSDRPYLVTDGPGEAKRYRCGMPRVEDYMKTRQYMFMHHLHDNRHEQGEGITCFFRFRSMYLKFFGMPYPGASDNRGVPSIDLQQPGTSESVDLEQHCDEEGHTIEPNASVDSIGEEERQNRRKRRVKDHSESRQSVDLEQHCDEEGYTIEPDASVDSIGEEERQNRQKRRVKDHSESRQSVDLEQHCDEEGHTIEPNASVDSIGEEERQNRRKRRIKDHSESRQSRRQQEKRQRRSKREKLKQKDKLVGRTAVGRKQDDLSTSQEQEERKHEETQGRSQEALFIEQSSPLDDTDQRNSADAITHRIEDCSTNSAQEDSTQKNTTPTIRQESNILPNTSDEHRVKETEMVQDKAEALDGRARSKRGRDRMEDATEREEIRARQTERGQLPVDKGRFQRLNNFPKFVDDVDLKGA